MSQSGWVMAPGPYTGPLPVHPVLEGDEEIETIRNNVLKVYEEKIKALPQSGNEALPITVFSLPGYLLKNNEILQKPKLVPIGPQYGADQDLRTMQEHKWWSARNFMNTYGLDPKACIEMIVRHEKKARLCYSEEISFNKEQFVQILLLDGCFILDFIYNSKHHNGVPDTFFNIPKIKATVLTDIMLLGNQIPYFIIHELFGLANPEYNSSCTPTSCKFCDQIFSLLPSGILCKNPSISCDKIHHLLHFYYLSVNPECHHGSATEVPSDERTQKNDTHDDKRKLLVMPSVAKLNEAGVIFRRKTEARHPFDVTFDHDFENGIMVMEIPALRIDDVTCVLLANLLVFEQISYGPMGIISHLALLFHSLINSEKDVPLLESSDVLVNMTGSKEEPASFFNQLNKWHLVSHSEDYLELLTSVQEFCDLQQPKHQAASKHDYFKNPWTVISCIAAAIVLLVLARPRPRS